MDMAHMCEEYYQTVLGYLISLTGGNYDVAEELTQETFYRAIKNAKSFRGDSKMSTWLCQIAKYTFYQYIDRKNRHKEVSMDTVTDLEAAQQIEKQYIDEEQKLEILKVIQKQQSPLKDVLMLRLLGDLSFKEIGEILGKNENWARVTFYRGKQIIGKELKENA
ncbi:MAG: RNA polymerase sigma factor [Lachnospiraceae bacterium]|nr:RNA polymerase sigma factor [Lachnospiraceae bacterium]